MHSSFPEHDECIIYVCYKHHRLLRNRYRHGKPKWEYLGSAQLYQTLSADATNGGCNSSMYDARPTHIKHTRSACSRRRRQRRPTAIPLYIRLIASFLLCNAAAASISETARARCTKPGSDRCFTVNTIDYRLLIIDITLCASIPTQCFDTLDWTTARESGL